MRAQARITKLTIRARHYLTIAPLLGLLLQCGEEALDPSNYDAARKWRMPVSGLTATFQPDKETVALSWKIPNEPFDFFRLYRTDQLDPQGRPDTATLDASGAKSRISKNATSFEDVPGPADGLYFYTIRAVRLDTVQTVDGRAVDTVEGSLSPSWPDFVRCSVGVVVRFTINYGSIFTQDTSCRLYIHDPSKQVSSVRFTQNVRTVEVKARVDENGTTVYDTIPKSLGILPPITNDNHNQIRDLQRSGFVQTQQPSDRIAATAGIHLVPDFDADDAQNPDRSLSAGADSVVSRKWVLPQGRGEKRVFAEITLSSGRMDTLVDVITTQPHRIDILLRDNPQTGISNMLDTSIYDVNTEETTPAKIFYSPSVFFSLKTFGDTTIDTAFDCWMMVLEQNEELKRSSLVSKSVLTTTPISYGLTSRTEHDVGKVYEYTIDTSKQTGKETLEDIIYFKQNRGTFTASTQSGVSANYEAVKMLRNQARTQFDKGVYGKKGFLMVLRFRELFFGDEFLKFYGYSDTTLEFASYWDWYLPIMNPDKSYDNPDHVGHGDIIVEPFNFALDSISVVDMGFANVEDLRLVIAREPPSFDWAKRTSPITVEELLSFRSFEYPYNINRPDYEMLEVRWDGIDPTTWPSGKYLMGVVVRDEYGNEGFATVDTTNVQLGYRNPWEVEVRTAN